MATIRTVSTHGAPTDADCPVVAFDENGECPGVFGPTTLWGNPDRWVPVSELLDLPPTTLPPVVTITIPRDVAKQYATRAWIGRHPQVIAEACREALEGDR